MWLAIDIGTKRTGVATSSSGRLATPWGVVRGEVDTQIQQLLALIDRFEVTTLVIGVPYLHHDAEHKPDWIEAYLTALKAGLGHRAIELVYVDETLSTKEVERRLGHRPNKNDDTDAAAAQLLLEDYLDEQNQKFEARNPRQS